MRYITFAIFSFRMWFHRPLRADDWLLHVVSLKCLDLTVLKLCFVRTLVLNTEICVLWQIVSPIAYNARGYVTGQMFNTKGEVKTLLPVRSSKLPHPQVSLCCLICICRTIDRFMNSGLTCFHCSLLYHWLKSPWTGQLDQLRLSHLSCDVKEYSDGVPMNQFYFRVQDFCTRLYKHIE